MIEIIDKVDFYSIFSTISFVFCLASSAGGLLYIFRFHEISFHPSYRFLQYSLILFYTFGYYSLWGVDFFMLLSIESNNLIVIANIVGLMGSPFLFIGVLVQHIWVRKMLSRPTRPWVSYAGFVILIITFLIVFYSKGTYDSLSLKKGYLLVSSAWIVFTGILFLVSQSVLFQYKAKLILACLTFLSTLGITLVALDAFLQPFNYLIHFLSHTALTIFYLKTAVYQRPQELVREDKLEAFVLKYAITRREQEIILEIYDGKTNQQIADKLYISLQTVKDHTSRIYLKTFVKNRSQLSTLLREFQP